MTVQDDAREHELCNLFNLQWDPHHERSGTDAVLSFTHEGESLLIQFEVKSTTGDSVSTARDVGMNHINRWRQKHWIIGFYSSTMGIRAQLNYAIYLSPDEISPWIDSLEEYIRPDFMLAQRTPEKLSNADLIAVCGNKQFYTLDDARKIFKKQWKLSEYKERFDYPEDSPKCYSPQRMLQILRHRARYTMERGATLNNPHIPKGFLHRFYNERITTDFALRLREKLSSFLDRNNNT